MIINKILLYAVVTLHFIVFIAMVACLIGLAINFIWYISIPLGVFIINMTNNGNCLLNTVEATLRVRLNKPLIKGFIRHYILDTLLLASGCPTLRDN